MKQSERPITISLKRYPKAGYTWEISIAGNDSDSITKELAAIDTKLRRKYGQTPVSITETPAKL